MEAKSGTTVKGRDEYNRLYRELESDRFDIIVIKSQDRLMRNTRDWYLFLDRMQKNRKQLYMYLERKFYTPDDALITGIKAILAEEYSRELSKKINNAHRNRQREGKSFVFTNRTYGYKKLSDGNIITDRREAEMIRMIFTLSAEGYGTHCSAKILFREGYRNHNGKELSPSVLRNIIRNPIYKGTVVQNRQHYDFESRQVRKNPPSEWLFHEHALPPIVEEALFERANRGLDERRQGTGRQDMEGQDAGGQNVGRQDTERQDTGRQGAGRRSGKTGDPYLSGYGPGKYDLSGKLFCGLCGSPFYRTVRRNKSGRVAEWKCSNYLRNGRRSLDMRRERAGKVERGEDTGCDNVHLDEKRLYAGLERLCRRSCRNREGEKEALLKEILAILQKALAGGDPPAERERLESRLHKITGQKSMLLEKLLDGIISDADFRMKNEELERRRRKAEEALRLMKQDPATDADRKNRMESLRMALEGGVIERAQTADMIRKISRIDVFPACLDIYAAPRILTGFSAKGACDTEETEKEGPPFIRIPQTYGTSHRPVMEREKEAVVDCMKQRPQITAKEIAKRMGVTHSLVRRRICELKKEGRIRYSTPNGKGEWQVLQGEMTGLS